MSSVLTVPHSDSVVNHLIVVTMAKVTLPNLLEYPPELKRLFDMNDHKGTNFRKYIRNYNSAFAFASFGANINHSPGRGPYCFCLHGQTCHYVSSLHPGDNDARKYWQLYIIDAQEAVQAILVSPENSNCLQAIVEVISNVMKNNPYAKLYKNMRTVELEKEEKTSMENVQPSEISMHFISGPDAKQFNYPTNSGIAVIFVGENGAPPINRDIVVYPTGQHKHRISYLS